MAEKPKTGKRKKILIALGGCLVLCLAAAVVIVLLARGSAEKKQRQTAGAIPIAAVPISPATLDRVRELYTLPLDGYIQDAAWSPDGRTIAAGTATIRDDPGLVRLWDASTGAVVHTFEPVDADRLAFSPDGSLLAAGGNGGVFVWRLADYSQVSHTPLNNPIIVDLAFSPDGRTLAYKAGDSVILLEMPSGKEYRTYTPDGDLRDFVFSPDGANLVTGAILMNDSGGDTEFTAWDIESGEIVEISSQPGALDEFTIFPDGRTYAGTFSVTTLRVWDFESGEVLQSFEGFRFGTTRFAVSPGGDVLAAGEGRGFETASPSGLRLFDAVDGREAPMLEGHKGVIKSLAFSPDGRYLLTASEDHTLRIWGVPPTGSGGADSAQ